jgi:signal transduction histidine kinase
VKLRTAFVLSLLAVIVVMAIPALFGLRHIQEVRRIALDLRERTAEAAFVVGRIQAGLERLDRYQRTHVATGDPELATRSRREIAAIEADLESLRESGYGDAVETARFPMMAVRVSNELTMLLMEGGHRDEATTYLRAEVSPLLAEAESAVGDLAADVDGLTAGRLSEADRIAGNAARTTTASLVLALLMAGVLVVLAAGVLTRPLNRLSGAMSQVAKGDFDPPENLPYERPDEIGGLFRAFRSMALRLADLDRLKAEFVALASHDLKTPVNVISGYTELMGEELEPSLAPRHRRILRALHEQSRTLAARLDQLLEISRIEASGLRLGLEQISLRHLAGELRRVYGIAGIEHGIEVIVQVTDSAPSFLVADPDRLRTEIFGNVLANSLRFTPPGGRIVIRASGRGGMVTFEISDTGSPIDPEDQVHVFDKYYTGRGRSSRLGAGLGLPIARAGVEAHGGTIEVESSSHGGVTFRLTLPIHPTVPGGAAVPGDVVTASSARDLAG